MGDLENGLLKINELLEKIYNETIKTKQGKKEMYQIAVRLASPIINKKKLDCIRNVGTISSNYLLQFLKEILDEDEIDYIITELNNIFKKNQQYINDIKLHYLGVKNELLKTYGFELKDNLDENILKYKLITKYLHNEYKFDDLLCQYICNKHYLDYEPYLS